MSRFVPGFTARRPLARHGRSPALARRARRGRGARRRVRAHRRRVAARRARDARVERVATARRRSASQSCGSPCAGTRSRPREPADAGRAGRIPPTTGRRTTPCSNGAPRPRDRRRAPTRGHAGLGERRRPAELRAELARRPSPPSPPPPPRDYPWVRRWLIWNEPNQRLWLRPTTPGDLHDAAPQPGVRRDPRGDPRRAGRGGGTAPRGSTGGVSPVAWLAGMHAAARAASMRTRTTRIRSTRSARRRSPAAARSARRSRWRRSTSCVDARRPRLPARRGSG